MFQENFKQLRKNKGFSQEQLAVRLNVVRQTISKWEKGLSVPDAQMLIDIAEVFEVSVSDLLGKPIEPDEKKDSMQAVAEELAKLNELLAIQQQKNDKLKKRIIQVVFVVILLVFFAGIYEQWCEVWNDFGGNMYHFLN